MYLRLWSLSSGSDTLLHLGQQGQQEAVTSDLAFTGGVIVLEDRQRCRQEERQTGSVRQTNLLYKQSETCSVFFVTMSCSSCRELEKLQTAPSSERQTDRQRDTYITVPDTFYIQAPSFQFQNSSLLLWLRLVEFPASELDSDAEGLPDIECFSSDTRPSLTIIRQFIELQLMFTMFTSINAAKAF